MNSPKPVISVIIPTHNPHPGRLQRTLAGLCEQSLPARQWETILVNNASTAWPEAAFFASCTPAGFSIVEEPVLGLTSARRRGFTAARGDFAILVDDDNVLAPDYLGEVIALFSAHPSTGALGGKSIPEFAVEPPEWTREFFPLLALRDLGPAPLSVASLRPPGSAQNEYPVCAPIGAGMALRRAAWEAWLNAPAGHALSDRRGSSLSSSGDNAIVLEVLKAGWAVAYFPSLVLTHLIPAGRLEPEYFARLNRGIQESWMRVLTQYEANPWPPLSAFGATMRQWRAWFAHRAWTSPAARIRWQGACGHFAGRVPQP
ncbi:MAG TPA: glycosyltransferase [Lacunisphaera sp.]|nr:glycosyltransferase [Lacunisphaera sp.]